MKVYLAGPFAPYKIKNKKFKDWRDFVIQEVKNKEFYIPIRDSREYCVGAFSEDDILNAMRCDCLLNLRLRGYEFGGGSFELAVVYTINKLNSEGKNTGYKNKPIINVDECSFLWPLNLMASGINFSNLEAAVKFLKKIKSDDKSNWIKILEEIE